MEKEILENKLATEKETKENKIVELKDEELGTISAGNVSPAPKVSIIIPVYDLDKWEL